MGSGWGVSREKIREWLARFWGWRRGITEEGLG